MPSSVVHLKICDLMKDELNINNPAEFYLGGIAPDAVNLEGFAPEDVRYAAHIRSKDYNVWKKNISEFCRKNDFKGNMDFFKGYVFHILVDIAWDEAVQPQLFAYLKKSGYSADEFKKLKWQELYRFNNVLCKEDWYNQVTDELKKAECFDIAGLSAEQIKKYRDYIINDYCGDKVIDEAPKFLNNMLLYTAAIKAVDYYNKI